MRGTRLWTSWRWCNSREPIRLTQGRSVRWDASVGLTLIHESASENNSTQGPANYGLVRVAVENRSKVALDGRHRLLERCFRHLGCTYRGIRFFQGCPVSEVDVMNQANMYGNPFDQVVIPEGRRILNWRPIHLIRGATRNLYEIEVTYWQPPNDYVTKVVGGLDPPLDCVCIPEHPGDIAECSRCPRVTCLKHCEKCPICGRVHCDHCLMPVLANTDPVLICKSCGDDLSRTGFDRLKEMIWGKQR